jgi:hypothetical protein
MQGEADDGSTNNRSRRGGWRGLRDALAYALTGIADLIDALFAPFRDLR